MRKLTLAVAALILGAATTLPGTPASAQDVPFLNLAVTPAVQSVAPGGSAAWNLVITNNNADTAFFQLTGFFDGLGSVPDITVGPYDILPFTEQVTLTTGQSVTFANFFQTDVAPAATTASYISLADATYDLYDSDTFANILFADAVASSQWTLNVGGSAVAPEPAALALIALTALPLSLTFRRKRAR